jgi:hypothetical protein
MRAKRLLGTALCVLSAGAARAACDEPERRQFDFWLGAWQVDGAQGLAGHNRIVSIEDGCALLEHWRGAKGGSGTSLNVYDPVARRWLQTWVDRDGTVLRLAGGWNGTAMVLEGTLPDAASGTLVAQRITWTPAVDGGVRQHWQARAAGSDAWSTVFDGRYRRDSGARD